MFNMGNFQLIILGNIQLILTVFGDKAFRRFMPGDSDNVNGKWSTSRINMALFDIQMCGFVNYSKNQVIPKADLIREKLIEMMSTNEEFINSIEIKTSDKNVLSKRFRMWLDALEDIIGSPTSDNRAFSFEVKKRLFNEDSTCKLCGQQILTIDDAEVDHILPYSKGGKTEITNAQITHRFCNRKKGNLV